MILRRLLPARLRCWLKCRLRDLQDSRTGIRSRIATAKNPAHGFTHAVTIEQPIMPGPFFDNKIHNIHTGAQQINHIIIEPGQVFSFWRLVQQPNAKNGFKTGRNIINGTLSESIGGGLCQLASILYHTALAAGLDILERHHHSIDIYKEDERFTPLGADATVVYGYKDLRFVNTHTAAISLVIAIEDKRLRCALLSAEPLTAAELLFERDHAPVRETVTTKRKQGSAWQVLGNAVYLKSGNADPVVSNPL